MQKVHSSKKLTKVGIFRSELCNKEFILKLRKQEKTAQQGQRKDVYYE